MTLYIKRKLIQFVRSIPQKVHDFFAAVPGAVKNDLNFKELRRITVTAVSAGSGAFGILEALMHSTGVVFPSPSDAALAAIVLTIILEAHRRLSHGEEIVPAPSRPRLHR
jgi:hypothetical protein